MKNDGFIKLSRKFFDHSFWKEDRPFSAAEAWLDLIRSARFEMKSEKVLVKLNIVTIKRAEFRASQRFLSKRWNRSIGWVNKFLNVLKNEGMITIRREHSESIIKILNFSKFNQNKTDGSEQTTNAKENGKENTARTLSDTHNGHGVIQTKEGKERKELKEGKERKEEENISSSIYVSIKKLPEHLNDEIFLSKVAAYAKINTQEAAAQIPEFIAQIEFDPDKNYRPLGKHQAHFQNWTKRRKEDSKEIIKDKSQSTVFETSL